MGKIWIWLNQLKDRVFGNSIEIQLKGRINIDINPEAFFSQFTELFESNSEFDGVVVAMDEAEFIYPSALIFLLAVGIFLKKRSSEIKFSIVEGSAIHEYLNFAGVDKFVSIPPYPENAEKRITKESRVFKLRTGDTLGDTYRTAVDMVDMLKEEQAMSLQVEAKVIDSVEEILRNIKQHASFGTFLIIGQSFPQVHRIRFSMFDDGVGIKSHITRREYDQMHNAFKREVTQMVYEKMKTKPANLAIEQAARKMVSGSDYINNSGAGLDFLISDLSVPTEGVVSILSEDGFVLWERGQMVKSFALPFRFCGTIVSWTVNCTPGTLLRYKDEEVGE